ncbi:MAG: PIN domain-containing protein [Microbacterium sp.]
MVTSYYLDSSVAARILLGHSRSAAEWFDDTTTDDASIIFSSRLLRTELTRVLRRELIDISRRNEVLDFVSMLPLEDAALGEAEAIILHIKTLDAIHLGALIRSGIDATVVTHDGTMRAVSKEIGFDVFDPVE